jgi:hypothetical protein
MAWSRRKQQNRDPFDHLADDRREAESDAWFLGPDDGPELEVEAGISSNLRDEDVPDAARREGHEERREPGGDAIT